MVIPRKKRDGLPPRRYPCLIQRPFAFSLPVHRPPLRNPSGREAKAERRGGPDHEDGQARVHGCHPLNGGGLTSIRRLAAVEKFPSAQRKKSRAARAPPPPVLRCVCYLMPDRSI
jgi:hypothetical protein